MAIIEKWETDLVFDGEERELFPNSADGDTFNPLGTFMDWDEAKLVGIHIGSGAILASSGDGYYNEAGNGTHHSSTLRGLLRAGNDIVSIEGINDLVE